MNFIGHALLAQAGSDDFLFGNLIADGIKGPQLAPWGAAIAEGVRWHRRVDAEVDRHPVVKELLSQMPQRRVAGIALDIVWDHFLSRQELSEELAERCYRVLGTRTLPTMQARMFAHMIEGRWLQGYADFDFTLAAIHGVGRRLRGPNRLAQLTPWLEAHYTLLATAYSRLWPNIEERLGYRPDCHAPLR